MAGNARAWPLFFALGALSAPGGAEDRRAHVDNLCPRLDAAEYDELDARVLLWLSSAHDTRAPPVVGCDAERSWVEWAGRRWPLPGSIPLSDDVLDVLETARREAISIDALAKVDAVPPPEAPPSWQVQARQALGGGIALGWETELPLRGQIGSTGMSFDIAVPSGPVLLGVREAFRFATNGAEGAFLDLHGLLAFGAPLRPRAPWGLALRLGVECFAAGAAATTSRGECVPSAAGGGRVALGLAATELWLGVDLNARLSSLQLASVESISDGFGVSLTAGVSFVDWSRRKTR
jgi:hypothetical protein